MANWKTTVAGILSALIGTAGPLTAYLATQMSPTATKISGGVTLAAAIARVWVGMLENDAPPNPPAAPPADPQPVVPKP
jgi:hypothetical protein